VNSPVTLSLDANEALVLFEFLSAESAPLAAVTKRQPGAWGVVNAILCQLEKQLVEPFGPDYVRLVAEARASVIERHGTQPGD